MEIYMKSVKIDEKLLLKCAEEAREKSICDISGKSVGAALLTAGGKIYTGANIESLSYSPSICAERLALFSALHAGEREFIAIAVSGGNRAEAPSGFVPCGVCRQLLSEFTSNELIILVKEGEGHSHYTLGALLPDAFGGGGK